MKRLVVAVLAVTTLQACVLRMPQLGLGTGSSDTSSSASAGPTSAAATPARAAQPQAPAEAPLVAPPCPTQDPVPPADLEKQTQALDNLYSRFKYDEAHWADEVGNAQSVNDFSQYRYARTWIAEHTAGLQPWFCSQRKGEQLSWPEEQLLRVGRSLDAFERAAKAKGDQLLPRADEALNKLEGQLRGCCGYLPGRERLVQLYGVDSPLRKARYEAEQYLAAVEVTFGPEAEQTKSRRARMDGFVSTILDAGELPADKYKATDRALVVKAITGYAEKVTKRKVQHLRLLGADWGRQHGTRWVGDTLREYDEGSLTAFVVVPTDDANVFDVWSIRPHRNFLQNGKIDFDVWVPQEMGQIRPKAFKGK